MPPEIYICYSNKDKPYAEEIVTYLEKRDIHCWIAPRDIPSGSSWATAIASAIENSKFLIVIVSANSETPQLMREVQSAISSKRTIISFRIEDIAPSGALRYFLNDAQWIDAFIPPLQQHLLKLSEVILRYSESC